MGPRGRLQRYLRVSRECSCGGHPHRPQIRYTLQGVRGYSGYLAEPLYCSQFRILQLFHQSRIAENATYQNVFDSKGALLYLYASSCMLGRYNSFESIQLATDAMPPELRADA